MTSTILQAIRTNNEDEGRDLIAPYYHSERPFTGASFELVGADDNPVDRITASDLYAVSTLAVKVPAKAGIAILGEQAEVFNELLREIPETSIGELTAEEFKIHLGPDSSAQGLWDRLRRNGLDEERWKIGPTTASKIMARKRPHLIPIEDSVVDRVVQMGRQDSWQLWWETFAEAGDYLETRAERLRESVNRPDLSTLRVFDVLLWSWGKSKGY